MTCPNPKHAKRITPLAGLPFSAIQAKSTAKTGVVQGEDANPNVKPAANAADKIHMTTEIMLVIKIVISDY